MFQRTVRISNIGTPGTTIGGPIQIDNLNARAVIVFVTWNAGTISSVTVNGIACTYTGYSASSSSLAAYILVNPPVGILTVQVTTSLSSTTVADIVSIAGVQCSSGSLEAVDIGATTSASTGGSSTVTAINTNTDKCWVFAFARSSGTLTLGGSGFTQRTSLNNIILADTNGPIDRRQALSLTTTYTPSGATNSHVLVAIRPAGVGSGAAAIL